MAITVLYGILQAPKSISKIPIFYVKNSQQPYQVNS